MPPPMTSSCSGTSASSSAPVESMTRGSSSGRNGRLAACEPAAMIAWANSTVVVADLSVLRAGELRLAVHDGDLAALGEALEAARELVDGLLLERAHAVEVDVGLAEARGRATPRPRVITFARCSSALDGMQPTLRQTPPRRS